MRVAVLRFAFVLVAGVLAIPVPCSAAEKLTPLPSEEQSFLKAALQGTVFQARLGELAREKGALPEVKESGRLLATECAQSAKEIVATAEKYAVPVVPVLDSQHEQTLRALAVLSGDSFDRTYLDQARNEQKEDAAAFVKLAESATNPEVKTLAERILATIAMHRNRIESLHLKLGTTAVSIAGTPGKTSSTAARLDGTRREPEPTPLPEPNSLVGPAKATNASSAAEAVNSPGTGTGSALPSSGPAPVPQSVSPARFPSKDKLRGPVELAPGSIPGPSLANSPPPPSA